MMQPCPMNISQIAGYGNCFKHGHVAKIKYALKINKDMKEPSNNISSQ